MVNYKHDLVSNAGRKVVYEEFSLNEQEKCYKGDLQEDSSLTLFNEEALQLLPPIENFELEDEGSEDACSVRDERLKMFTDSFPGRAICRLIITRGDGTQGVGTGWLNGPGSVVTAGHCVYSKRLNQWSKSIVVVPGKNNTNELYGKFISSNFWSVAGWTQDKNTEYDYGVIELNEKIGHELGYFGFGCADNLNLDDKKIINSGYPTDKRDINEIATQWYSKGEIHNITEKNVYYMLDTYKGNSGGPVWLDDEKYQAICIHTNGGCPNYGTKITKQVFNNLLRLKELCNK
ncbi:trypsin-like serine protease [Bacillus spizizenii]|nr:trypsin-like serine protease [Bacillus spizizenii]